jgi:hypothetical protein
MQILTQLLGIGCIVVQGATALPWKGADPTPAHFSEPDFKAWAPKPTSLAELKNFRRLDSSNDVCGYVDGDPGNYLCVCVFFPRKKPFEV